MSSMILLFIYITLIIRGDNQQSPPQFNVFSIDQYKNRSNFEKYLFKLTDRVLSRIQEIQSDQTLLYRFFGEDLSASETDFQGGTVFTEIFKKYNGIAKYNLEHTATRKISDYASSSHLDCFNLHLNGHYRSVDCVCSKGYVLKHNKCVLHEDFNKIHLLRQVNFSTLTTLSDDEDFDPKARLYEREDTAEEYSERLNRLLLRQSVLPVKNALFVLDRVGAKLFFFLFEESILPNQFHKLIDIIDLSEQPFILNPTHSYYQFVIDSSGSPTTTLNQDKSTLPSSSKLPASALPSPPEIGYVSNHTGHWTILLARAEGLTKFSLSCVFWTNQTIVTKTTEEKGDVLNTTNTVSLSQSAHHFITLNGHKFALLNIRDPDPSSSQESVVIASYSQISGEVEVRVVNHDMLIRLRDSKEDLSNSQFPGGVKRFSIDSAISANIDEIKLIPSYEGSRLFKLLIISRANNIKPETTILKSFSCQIGSEYVLNKLYTYADCSDTTGVLTNRLSSYHDEPMTKLYGDYIYSYKTNEPNGFDLYFGPTKNTIPKYVPPKPVKVRHQNFMKLVHKNNKKQSTSLLAIDRDDPRNYLNPAADVPSTNVHPFYSLFLNKLPLFSSKVIGGLINISPPEPVNGDKVRFYAQSSFYELVRVDCNLKTNDCHIHHVMGHNMMAQGETTVTSKVEGGEINALKVDTEKKKPLHSLLPGEAAFKSEHKNMLMLSLSTEKQEETVKDEIQNSIRIKRILNVIYGPVFDRLYVLEYDTSLIGVLDTMAS